MMLAAMPGMAFATMSGMAFAHVLAWLLLWTNHDPTDAWR